MNITILIIIIIGVIGGLICVGGLTFGALSSKYINKHLGAQVMIAGAFLASPMIFYGLYNIDLGVTKKVLPSWVDSLFYIFPPIIFIGGCYILFSAIKDYKCIVYNPTNVKDKYKTSLNEKTT